MTAADDPHAGVDWRAKHVAIFAVTWAGWVLGIGWLASAAGSWLNNVLQVGALLSTTIPSLVLLALGGFFGMRIALALGAPRRSWRYAFLATALVFAADYVWILGVSVARLGGQWRTIDGFAAIWAAAALFVYGLMVCLGAWAALRSDRGPLQTGGAEGAA